MSDRHTALRELESLEATEADLRDQLLRELPTVAALHQRTIPDLAEVQAVLAPGQALLSYQLWDGEAMRRAPLKIGKSWLTLISKEYVQAIALPGRRELRSRFEISLVPSAAIWVHLKNAAREALPGPGSAALVLFAPDIGGEGAESLARAFLEAVAVVSGAILAKNRR